MFKFSNFKSGFGNRFGGSGKDADNDFHGKSPLKVHQALNKVMDKANGWQSKWGNKHHHDNNDRDCDDRDDDHDDDNSAGHGGSGHGGSGHGGSGSGSGGGTGSGTGTGFPAIPADTQGITFHVDLENDGVTDNYLFVSKADAANPSAPTFGDYYQSVTEDMKELYPDSDPSKSVIKATIYSASAGESYYYFTGNETTGGDDTDPKTDDDDCDDDKDGHGHGRDKDQDRDEDKDHHRAKDDDECDDDDEDRDDKDWDDDDKDDKDRDHGKGRHHDKDRNDDDRDEEDCDDKDGEKDDGAKDGPHKSWFALAADKLAISDADFYKDFVADVGAQKDEDAPCDDEEEEEELTCW